MRVTVVGGGMAGSEAAWQLAEAGVDVSLVEMKPCAMSPAHQSPLLGELVCSNSLRSDDPVAPAGLLKQELRACGSMVIACADAHRVPAGQALAVERFGFSRAITQRLALHPRIRIERRRLDDLPAGPVIVATGPLTEGALADVIRQELGGDRMYFYDAIAPIVAADSIDWDHAFRASRWGRDGDVSAAETDDSAAARAAKRRPPDDDPGEACTDDPSSGRSCTSAGDVGVGDYVNCPLDKAQYEAFVAAVNAGRKVLPHEFEEPRYFESCMPIEVMAERGPQTLRFGPMRPIGLVDPRTGRRPWAVVQLRPENRYLTAYNLVGFQTRLAYPEQQRIFAMIPALARAELLRFGSIHRNTYIDAPARLGARFELRDRPEIRFAGLLTGVEGYIESCAMGLVVAWLLAAELAGRAAAPPPPTTMLGGLYHHVTAPREPKYKYGPTNVNYGLLPPLPGTRKDNKKPRMAERARADLAAWLAAIGVRAVA
ncbi:MAG: methylenetetrahydrofolate--tRNA-(uracil(54)-C(5))-methyltransferase (FADH(2)-oxidizing) TrmFO [Deltaproteobacteria bacterium]|nr:methylenetetrahydrofolate--tRNA-(uracil(54)-C(5))-methyltransferase (FADH(2)-oxidizing) TrmFO [Deltaproteobacteria bacterium]